MGLPRPSSIQLSLGVAVAFVSALFVATPPFLIPALTSDFGLGLTGAGFLAVLTNLGMVSMLVMWGLLADRYGERLVLNLGLALTVVAACGAVMSREPYMLGAFLLCGGMTSASANAATGRIVIGWASPHRRGLAMGIRQMAIPLGVMVAATGVPPLAERYGVSVALVLPALACALVLPGALIGLRNPERPPRPPSSLKRRRASNPYRESGYLRRIHAASALLAVPQLALQTFGLVWIMSDLGWSAAAAGATVGAAQLLGAVGRVLIGAYSDVTGRTRIIRCITLSIFLSLGLLGLAAQMGWTMVAVVLFVVSVCLSVADNGPAFTTVAEFAGPFWSGRALGIQNTAQNFVGFLVGPVIGALIELVGFPSALAMLALAPALAWPFIPRVDRRYED